MMEAMKLAEMMSSARLVPQALQKSPADCLMVVMQAIRWQMDPFAVAQECSVIQGKLMHSGKLVAAVVNARGDLAERLSFTYAAQGDARTITVRGRLRGEPEPREISVRFGDAKTQNKVWQSQPDQQLAYHGTRVWARRHTPELMLGVYSPEEFDEPSSVVREPIDVTPATPIDTVADLDAFAEGDVIPDDTGLFNAAHSAAVSGSVAFRSFWAALNPMRRDVLRSGLPGYQEIAAAADDERARDEDPFGLPPLGEAHEPEPVAEAPAVPFAAAVRALVPVAGDDGALDWAAWSRAFVALVEQATPAEAQKCRLSDLPHYGKCRTQDGDAARAVLEAVNTKSKEAVP
jgi:hypothetical protein